MSGDKYSDFKQLATNEVEDADFRIRTRVAGATLILAPHGGGIEPGTSELAEAIAGADHSLYLFEGIKAKQNGALHITSTRFKEPRCDAMLERANAVLAIHGERGNETVVYVGGLDTSRVARISAALLDEDFNVRKTDKAYLEGKASGNVCNRGRAGAGVQLEIAEGLRCILFRRLSPRSERQHTTEAFDRFVAAIRHGLWEP